MDFHRMSIEELQETFVTVAKNKIPDLPQQEPSIRLISVVAQMGELANVILYELFTGKPAEESKSPNHLITSLFIDLLFLAKKCEVNWEKELEDAYNWWQK